MKNAVATQDRLGGKAVAASARAAAARLGVEDDDLTSGVRGGFAVMSIRGSKWRVKHGGEEELITDAQGEVMPSVRVLMLKASKNISKIYYDGGYVEGSTENPDCFSNDGIRPDASVENPQSVNCANCPKNAFGSRITEQGKKSKACADSRRIALVPEGDLANERFGGGPMLLRVPAASLTELSTFGKGLKQKGYSYNQIITRLSFDPDPAYPKIQFKAVRPLTEEEGDTLGELLDDASYVDKLEYILNTLPEVAASTPAAPVVPDDPTDFEEPPAPAPAKAKAAPASAPVKAKAAPAKPKAAAKPVVAEVQEELPLEEGEEVAPEDNDEELQQLLDSLEAMN